MRLMRINYLAVAIEIPFIREASCKFGVPKNTMPFYSKFRLLLKTKLPGILLFVFFIQSHCFGEIHPANGSVLNYTQVMFEYNYVPGANNYKLIIESADGSQPFFLET